MTSFAFTIPGEPVPKGRARATVINGHARVYTPGTTRRFEDRVRQVAVRGAVRVAVPVAHALRADGFDASEGGTGRGTPIVPMAFDARQSDVIQCGDKSRPLDTNGTSIAVLTPANGDCRNASTQEADASALLRRVRNEIGAQAFAEWGLGILDSLQPPEILRSALHGSELRPTPFSRRWVVDCALSREEGRAAGAMQSLREAERARRASQGWEPPEQLARELGAYLSGLPQQGAQAERFMLDLWRASEGIGLLRQALSAIQDARRPACREGQSASSSLQVRRLTVEECEFLMGFPRGYTAVPYRGKPAADGPRYKALGNSMAVPVIAWIGRRIEAAHGWEAGT